MWYKMVMKFKQFNGIFLSFGLYYFESCKQFQFYCSFPPILLLYDLSCFPPILLLRDLSVIHEECVTLNNT